METNFDAIVIGTGISGGWAAKELCEKGLNTLVLERGRMIKHVEDGTTINIMVLLMDISKRIAISVNKWGLRTNKTVGKIYIGSRHRNIMAILYQCKYNSCDLSLST